MSPHYSGPDFGFPHGRRAPLRIWEKTRHPPGRVLDHARGREQPAGHLHARLGQHGRTEKRLERHFSRTQNGSQPPPSTEKDGPPRPGHQQRTAGANGFSAAK